MTKTTLEQIVKEGQEEFNKQFPRLEVESFLADFAQKIVEGVRESVVPEEGIRWMQEGSNKNRGRRKWEQCLEESIVLKLN